MIRSDIEAFLHYGYIPRHRPRPELEPWGSIQVLPAATDDGDALKAGLDAFRVGFSDIDPSMLHAVPLSGGLDSRAILAELLRRGLRDSIVAITVGTPGTWDFDIGMQVARAAGVESRAIDLTRIAWEHDALLRHARLHVETEQPAELLESYLFQQIRTEFGADPIYWVGYMGDPLSGSHLLPTASTTWDQACTGFATRSRYCRSRRLTSNEFDPGTTLPSTPIYNSPALTFDEQLDFGLRQHTFVRPIVLRDGYRHRAPFLADRWVQFALSLPPRARRDQSFYRRMLVRGYPDLFSLPTKTRLGLPLGAPDAALLLRKIERRLHAALPPLAPRVPRWTNYIDFETAFRTNPELRRLTTTALDALDQRVLVPWLRGSEVLRDHGGKASHADALRLLVSLELLIEARNDSPGTTTGPQSTNRGPS